MQFTCINFEPLQTESFWYFSILSQYHTKSLTPWAFWWQLLLSFCVRSLPNLNSKIALSNVDNYQNAGCKANHWSLHITSNTFQPLDLGCNPSLGCKDGCCIHFQVEASSFLQVDDLYYNMVSLYWCDLNPSHFYSSRIW